MKRYRVWALGSLTAAVLILVVVTHAVLSHSGRPSGTQADLEHRAPPMDPAVLLVDDDDNDPDVQITYTLALDALGEPYDIWDTHNSDREPSLEQLSAYSITIWFTGFAWTIGKDAAAGPGPEAEIALSAWLESGNCLFISGQDYLFVRDKTGFIETYLGLSSFRNDSANHVAILGQGSPFSGLGPYDLSYPLAAGEPPAPRDYADVVWPDATAGVAILGVDDNGVARPGALFKENHRYRTTFLAFPFEVISGELARAEVMGKFLNWCRLPKPPPTHDGDIFLPVLVTG